MSPASYLTAPPRDAASIVAPSGRKTAVTMLGMALLSWISPLFFVVAIVGSIAVAVARGLGVWRSFRRFSKVTSAAIGNVLDTATEVERHAVALAAGTERLDAALTRLEESRAQLAVIRAAASEVGAPLSAARGAVPRK
jgi:phage-related minor tail protein